MKSRLPRVAFLASLALALGRPVWGAGFSSVTPLPEPFYGHALVSLPGSLCHIGGISGPNGALSGDKVFCAPVQADGGLGAWAAQSSLPEPVFFHSALAVGDRVFVLGGYHYNPSAGLFVSSAVFQARLGADGSLSPWSPAPPLPEGAFFMGAAAWNGTIYVTGGWDGLKLLSSVSSADIGPDGTLSAWTSRRSLPEGVYTHAAVSNGTLYVLGGAVDGGSLIQNTVYHAPINADKSLGGWATTSPLPQPLSNHAAAVTGGRVIVAGGWTGTSPTDAVVSADIAADQALGGWGALPSLPQPLYMLGGAVSGGYLYVSGGMNNLAQTPVQATVYSTPLPEPLPPPAPDDALAPRTALAVAEPKFSSAPVFITPATLLSLAATDEGGSGVAATLSAVDDAAFAPYGAPFKVAAEGAHWLRYYSVDSAGNQEAAVSAALAVDATPPATELGVSPAPFLAEDGVMVLGGASAVSFQARDPEAAGVAAGVGRTESSLGSSASLGPDELALSEGEHTLFYRSVDNVGNAEAVRSASLRVDLTHPVSSLDVADSGVSLFGIELLTPQTDLRFSAEDPVSGGVRSGVSRILYSVDSGAAQTYSAAFRLPAGAHSVSFWSLDNAGNEEPASSAALSIGSFLTDSIAALDSVTLAGGASVTGAVRANGAFTASGRSIVSGDVTALSVRLNGRSEVRGAATEGPAGVAASADQAAARAWAQENNDNAAIPSRLLSGGALVLDAFDHLRLPAGTYYIKGLTVRDLGRLSLEGQAAVFVDGPIVVTGLGRVNESGRADDLWVFCAGASVQVNGAARAAFNLYAPEAAVSLSGLGQLAGRILGRTVALSGMAKDPSPDALPGHRRKGRFPVRAVASVRLERVLTALARQARCAAPSLPVGRPPALGKGGRPVYWPASAPLRLPPLPVLAHAALAQVAAAHGQAVRASDGSGVVVPAGALLAGLAVSVAREIRAEAHELIRRESSLSRRELAAAGPAVQFGPEGTRFVKPVTLELPFDRTLYPDATAQATLAVHYWNPAKGDWEALPSVVDAAAGLARAQTDHFSLYQVLSGAYIPAAGPAVDAARVACNPLRPDCGTLRIGGLPADTRVRIYTLSGTLVKDLGADANGVASWDGTNASGAPAASGVYFAFAQGGGKSKTIKIAVER